MIGNGLHTQESLHLLNITIIYREQEIDFLTRTYNQMEGLQAELEQCKQQNRDLENTLAQANEEQEALAAQLYETGHALDEANNEVTTPLITAEQSTYNCSFIYMQVQHKEHELDQMKNVISSKEQEVARLKQQGTATIKMYPM